MMRHPAMENPTVVVLTDRNDLDDQLFDETFAATKPGSPLPEAPVQAETRAHLKELLAGRQSGGIIFTTIQKFGLSQGGPGRRHGVPARCRSGSNIVVMVDEAHRSNYDFIDGFARHLRDGLPNATFIGFTGTPIDEKDRSTAEVFGEYIDVYDLTQAVEDGATVKVFYEPRLAKVELPADAREQIDDAFDGRHLGHRGASSGAVEVPVGARRGDRRLREADQGVGRRHRRRTGRPAATSWPARA